MAPKRATAAPDAIDAVWKPAPVEEVSVTVEAGLEEVALAAREVLTVTMREEVRVTGVVVAAGGC
jgi:hypothetical protein